jgi:hypothetical protein
LHCLDVIEATEDLLVADDVGVLRQVVDFIQRVPQPQSLEP